MSVQTLFPTETALAPAPRVQQESLRHVLDDPSWDVADVPSPIGIFRIGYRDDHVMYVDLRERGVEALPVSRADRPARPPFPEGSPPRQLQEYFQGRRRGFDVSLDFLTGSAFDRKVWQALSRIPYGSYRTYGEVARSVGTPQAARAVGGAAHRNPIPIVVPCHRLVGGDRSLTGFGLGLWRKRWLLEHEGAYPLAPVRPEQRPRGQRQGRLP
jgi:methylated-DNA-[protein]-cysteine S-methyltransferase